MGALRSIELDKVLVWKSINSGGTLTTVSLQYLIRAAEKNYSGVKMANRLLFSLRLLFWQNEVVQLVLKLERIT
jgi:hypothetical protein